MKQLACSAPAGDPFELEKPLGLTYSSRLPVATGPTSGFPEIGQPTGGRFSRPGRIANLESWRPAGQQQFVAEHQ